MFKVVKLLQCIKEGTIAKQQGEPWSAHGDPPAPSGLTSAYADLGGAGMPELNNTGNGSGGGGGTDDTGGIAWSWILVIVMGIALLFLIGYLLWK